MESTTKNDESRTAEGLIALLQRWRGTRCPKCALPLGHHDVLMNVALGFKESPHCLNCLAQALQQDREQLQARLRSYVQSKECYRTAWEWAERADLSAVASGSLAREQGTAGGEMPPHDSLAVPPAQAAVLPADAEWDAGEMGCGDLVLELRHRLGALEPGRIFKLYARDPGAPEDLPAWCRLTGHRLLRVEHPIYWIKRKE